LHRVRRWLVLDAAVLPATVEICYPVGFSAGVGLGVDVREGVGFAGVGLAVAVCVGSASAWDGRPRKQHRDW
jgi:hypothetical protein